MSRSLVVGCPVFRREWILRDWFAHVSAACFEAGVDCRFVFVLSEQDPSCNVIKDVHPDATLVWSEEDLDREDVRDWGLVSRYQHMADVRNQMLAKVRQMGPDLFLSLDSDVLLNSYALSGMAETLVSGGYGAVAGKTYMSARGRGVPNFGHQSGNGGLVRADTKGRFAVDVIMAVKLMAPEAYHVDYVGHGRGEDIGWSGAARRAGLRLGFDGRYPSKHVFERWQLDVVDDRCGF